MEKMIAPAPNTIALNDRIVVPSLMENLFMKMTHKISSPPAEPKDFSIRPDPVPMRIPPKRAAGILS